MEVTYQLFYTKNAIKDIRKLKSAKLVEKAKTLCELLSNNPFPAHSKQLIGDMKGRYSIRINLKHRLVYEVFTDKKIVKILSMWSHYGGN